LNLEIYYRYLPFYRAGAFDAIDILERAARVRGGGMRRRALLLLGEFRSERARDLLVAALDDPDTAARAVARRVLVQQECDLVVPALVADLEAAAPFTRVQAIDALAKLGQRRFGAFYIQALRDPERVVRAKALDALRDLTRESFGFRPDAPTDERDRAIAQWELWWKAENAPLPPGGLRGTLLIVDPEAPGSVVLDIGREKGVRRGLRFEVRRDGRAIAVLQADKVEPTLTVARIVQRGEQAIREGDPVRSLPEVEVSQVDP
jgi:hypothetical protein